MPVRPGRRLRQHVCQWRSSACQTAYFKCHINMQVRKIKKMVLKKSNIINLINQLIDLYSCYLFHICKYAI